MLWTIQFYRNHFQANLKIVSTVSLKSISSLVTFNIPILVKYQNSGQNSLIYLLLSRYPLALLWHTGRRPLCGFWLEIKTRIKARTGVSKVVTRSHCLVPTECWKNVFYLSYSALEEYQIGSGRCTMSTCLKNLNFKINYCRATVFSKV